MTGFKTRKRHCEKCTHWVKYNKKRYECGRALGGFDCSYEGIDGKRLPTYEELEEELTEKGKQIEELEAQIEKMKCCTNCKHYKHLVGCMIADQPNHRQCDVDNWKSWKLKEN